MQQKLATPGRLVVSAIAVRVFADVRVKQPGFVVLNPAVGFLSCILRLWRLSLRFPSHHTGFDALQQEIIVARLPVIAQNFKLLILRQFLP